MSRADFGEAVAAVQGYVHYLQRLGVTELSVTFATPGHAGAASMPMLASASARPTPVTPTEAEPAVRGTTRGCRA